MNLFSPSFIKDKVYQSIDKNTRGSLTGISGPKYSGKDYLKNEFLKDAEKMTKRVFLNVNAQSMTYGAFLENLIAALKVPYDLQELPDCGSLNLSDSISYILKSIDGYNSVQFIIVVDTDSSLLLDEQYHLFGQFRNYREKSKTEYDWPIVHFIILGNLNFSMIASQCKEHNTSLIFDNYFSLDAATIEDLRAIFKAYPQLNSSPYSEIYLEYLLELSKGCYGIIEYVLKSLETTISCEQINNVVLGLASEPNFSAILSNTLSNISNEQLNILMGLLSGKFFMVEGNEYFLEDLYSTGLFKITHSFGMKYLELRSWVHEVFIRSNLHEIRIECNVYKEIQEIIPPTFVLNKIAYQLVMRIENILRNLLTLRLATRGYSRHPFENLIPLGKIKKMSSGNNQDYMTYCCEQKNKTIVKHMVEAHSALASYLELGDLLNLFLDKSRKDDTVLSVYGLLTDIFPDKSELENILRRLRKIRNPIAHNNLITENTIKDLHAIYCKITQRLSNPEVSII